MSLLNSSIYRALLLTQSKISGLVNTLEGREVFQAAFGVGFDGDAAMEWLEHAVDNSFKEFPQLKIIESAAINQAFGAYSADTNTIYLAQEFLNSNASNSDAVSKIILEEFGHFLDSRFNELDTPGDEGELFAALVRNEFLSGDRIKQIKNEDDRVSVLIDNQIVQIEQANPGENPAFDLIGLTQLRNDPQFAGIDGSGFSVAVIDTGIDLDHPLLASNYVAGYDFIDNDDIPEDAQGHGTHVSGTIGANDETIGVASGVGLISLRTLDNEGSGTLTDVEESLEWVLANREQYNITAVNLSLGLGFFELESGLRGDILSDDIRRLEQAGVTVIGSAGNSYFTNSGQANQANLAFPAIASTVAVGAVWQDGTQSNVTWQSGSIDYTTGGDRIASFSQRLDAPNVVFAPGAIITSTVPGGGLGGNGGTSQASPHVAGLVALMQEASLQFSGRLLTPDEVNEILRTTGDTITDGDDENDNVINTNTSYKRINAYNAIAEIKRRSDNIAPLPENNPDSTISGDSNGTIAGAFVAPAIDGSSINTVVGSIGRDGGNIRSNDVDIYSFELLSPGTVGLEVTTDPSNPEDFDSYLRLFNTSGNQIALNDDLAEGNGFSRLDVNLEPGKYYVGVSGYNNISYDPNVAGSGTVAATGNYSLQFSLSNQDPDGIISGAREVNLGSDLEPLLFAGNIGTDRDKLVGSQDVDLFRIVAPDNGVLFLDIDTPYQNDFVDSFVRIFDRNGNELIFADNQQAAENDDSLAFDLDSQLVEFISPNDPNIVLDNANQTDLRSGSTSPTGNYQKGNYGHTTDSFIGARVERGEVYYIGVSDFSNSTYNATNLSNRTDTGGGGSYELITTFVNDDVNGSISQMNEVTPLPISDRTGVIGQDGATEVGDRDVDFYRFNSPKTGILEIAVNSSAQDPVDTVTTIFNSQGQRLGVNDELNSLDSLLRYQIEANTDYYVAVTGFGNQNFDPFALGSGTGGDTGTYTINSNLISLAAADTLSDDNIGSSALQTITSGETLLGNIGNDSGLVVGNTDLDFYRFVADADKTVSIKTIVNEEFSADTYLRVFDSNGNEIAANDNASDRDRGSLIELEVTAGTEYYLGVNGNSPQAGEYDPVTGEGAAPGSSGNYNIRVSSDSDLVSGSTVYRFFRPDLGVHFYTADGNERDVITDMPQFNYEGESFVAAADTADPLTGARPVYRFLNTGTGTHLYTMSEVERDFVDGNLDNYIFEGIAYHGYQSDRPGATPLYRFYNPTVNAHFYTPSASEKEFVEASLPNYQLEGDSGIAFYVEPFVIDQ